jgi:hypothetical protein
MQSRATHMLRVLLLLLRCWLQPSMLGLPGAKLLAWLVPCVPTPRARRGNRRRRRRRRVATCTACGVVRAGLRGGARRSHALPPATALITYPIHARIAGRRPPCMGGGGGVECALSLCQSECFCWITFVLGPQNDKTDPSLGGLNLSDGWAATTVFVHGPLN